MQDYARIEQAILYLECHARNSPALDDVARAAGLGAPDFQRLLERWAGIGPQRFLESLTPERTRRVLEEARGEFEAAGAAGPAANLDAIAPGDAQRLGRGLVIDHGVHTTPFGHTFIATTARGICAIAFCADSAGAEAVAQLRRAWPEAECRARAEATAAILPHLFPRADTPPAPPRLLVRGTDFQVRVWTALLTIPPGRLATYEQVARAIGAPNALRAVGSAVGANPISWLIPCHRVIRKSGHVGEYHWGSARKRAMLAWEARGEEIRGADRNQPMEVGR